MSPDEAAFRADVSRPDFRLGEAEGRWRLLDIAWPHACIGVVAKDEREYVLRFDGTGYPTQPPTARPWDPLQKTPLAHKQWPSSRGGRLGAVFNPNWNHGCALYLPCDRLALAGHPSWSSDMPSKMWRPSQGITLYLELVHELLHCQDYSPPAGATP